MKTIITLIIRALIFFYQKLISPLLPARCRYNPTCSQYALDAFKKHKFWHAAKLTTKRILSCHPWGGHGHDPVL